jgi:DNA-directed RNA polymerase II subunit RPB7
MFFIHQLERTITMHPSNIGPGITDRLADQLMKDVEGTNTGNYYIICVMDVPEISDGRVIPGNGFAEYTVSYRAVVWKPFKGECVSWQWSHDGNLQQQGNG